MHILLSNQSHWSNSSLTSLLVHLSSQSSKLLFLSILNGILLNVIFWLIHTFSCPSMLLVSSFTDPSITQSSLKMYTKLLLKNVYWILWCNKYHEIYNIHKYIISLSIYYNIVGLFCRGLTTPQKRVFATKCRLSRRPRPWAISSPKL